MCHTSAENHHWADAGDASNGVQPWRRFRRRQRRNTLESTPQTNNPRRRFVACGCKRPGTATRLQANEYLWEPGRPLTFAVAVSKPVNSPQRHTLR